MPKGRERPAATCHPDRIHEARGMCRPCYQSQRLSEKRSAGWSPRATCHADKPLRARGLCSACYDKTQDRTALLGRRRVATLRHRYGIDASEWQRMYAEQNGKCAVCDLPFGDVKPHVDHAHATGRVRGLVHPGCNTIVGFVETRKIDLVFAYIARHAA